MLTFPNGLTIDPAELVALLRLLRESNRPRVPVRLLVYRDPPLRSLPGLHRAADLRTKGYQSWSLQDSDRARGPLIPRGDRWTAYAELTPRADLDTLAIHLIQRAHDVALASETPF